MIDITDPAMIDAAAKTVEQSRCGARPGGVVNNAGIVKPGPIKFEPLEEFRRQLEVDLIGPLSVIQAFSPDPSGPRADRERRVDRRPARGADRRVIWAELLDQAGANARPLARYLVTLNVGPSQL